MKRALVAVAAALTLVGCAPSEPPQPTAAPAPKPEADRWKSDAEAIQYLTGLFDCKAGAETEYGTECVAGDLTFLAATQQLSNLRLRTDGLVAEYGTTNLSVLGGRRWHIACLGPGAYEACREVANGLASVSRSKKED